jgi:hypothetical protein
MSICIAYNGKLRDPTLVPELVSDLTAKAGGAGWLFKTMKELRAEGLVTCTGLEGISPRPTTNCIDARSTGAQAAMARSEAVRPSPSKRSRARSNHATRGSSAWSSGSVATDAIQSSTPATM